MTDLESFLLLSWTPGLRMNSFLPFSREAKVLEMMLSNRTGLLPRPVTGQAKRCFKKFVGETIRIPRKGWRKTPDIKDLFFLILLGYNLYDET